LFLRPGAAPKERVSPIRRPLVNSPHFSLPGVVWFRTVGLGQYGSTQLVAGLRARGLICSVRRSAPVTHRDPGAGAGDRLQHPWHVCAPRKSSVPGRVQGLRTAIVSCPDERGANTSWLATWAHLQQRAKRRSAGAQSEEMVYANTFSELPALAEINQRPERLQTVHGRASRKSRHGLVCGRPPAGRRAGWCAPFFGRSTSWPAARTGWRSERPR